MHTLTFPHSWTTYLVNHLLGVRCTETEPGPGLNDRRGRKPHHYSGYTTLQALTAKRTENRDTDTYNENRDIDTYNENRDIDTYNENREIEIYNETTTHRDAKKYVTGSQKQVPTSTTLTNELKACLNCNLR